jgi:hypothetical protein
MSSGPGPAKNDVIMFASSSARHVLASRAGMATPTSSGQGEPAKRWMRDELIQCDLEAFVAMTDDDTRASLIA